MQPLRSGQLRHQVTIQQPLEEKDGKGGYLDDQWDNFATVWAEVTALDGREALIDHVLEGSSIYRIRIRYLEGIGSDWQLLYDGLTLNIAAPPSDPDGRREQLAITATTKAALKAA